MNTNLTILNTRPTHQNNTLHAALTAIGFQVINIPLLTIKPTPLTWLRYLPSFTQIHVAVFTSRNAVEYFFNGLTHQGIRWPNHIKILAIGQGTAQALLQYKQPVDEMPSVADSEHLLQCLPLQQVAGKTILIIKGQGGRQLLEETLQQRQAHVITLPVYRRGKPRIRFQLKRLWQHNTLDMIILTSQQAIEQLFACSDTHIHAWLKQKKAVVISARLALCAKRAGMQQVILASYDTIVPTLQGLITHDHQPRS